MTTTPEDRIAAVALGKTVAFLLYSFVLSFVVAATLLFATPLGEAGEATQNLVLLSVLALLEVLLLYLVIRGWLPGTTGDHAEPFSEVQLAAGCTVLSALTLIWPFHASGRIVVDVGANGLLALGVLVYFIAKSVMGRCIRWRVLAVLVLPAALLTISIVRLSISTDR